MHLFWSGGIRASAYIIRKQPEILNSLSHTAGPHMYLPVTLCSNGMLALDDDDSRFLKGSWCEGAWTVKMFPNSEKHQHGHHDANSPRDGAHGWASCDHISCWCEVSSPRPNRMVLGHINIYSVNYPIVSNKWISLGVRGYSGCPTQGRSHLSGTLLLLLYVK